MNERYVILIDKVLNSNSSPEERKELEDIIKNNSVVQKEFEEQKK